MTAGSGVGRRGLLAGMAAGLAAGAGRGATLPKTDPALIEACDRFAGLDFTPHEHQQMAAAVDDQLDRLRALRAITLPNDLAPAELFDPRLPGWTARPALPASSRVPAPPLPGDPESIAFAPASAQATWIASGKLTSRALVDLYLDRIADRAPRLECIVTLFADFARAEADRLDEERVAGRLRGPLHGLPYGLKDLFDTAHTPTTWGAEPYRDRIGTKDAVVVERLRAAGAILIAKTSCGALAYGDIWFGGRTRNPWNVEEGSSGSSAGSAAAVADGLCSFAIGTETMGSIVAPSTRCGTVGLRPTFGRVPRTGAMALCWSLDKVGVIARTAGDAALALAAINGKDPGDAASIEMPFAGNGRIDPKTITLGYRPEWFEAGLPTDRVALAAARAAGFRLVEITMPATSTDLLSAIVAVESAAAFEELTLSGKDDSLKWQDDAAWPNTWRAARFEPAIGYVQAQRLRRRLMGEIDTTMAGIDAILHPSPAAHMIAIGNHTGHPALVLPTGLLDQPTRTGFHDHLDPKGVAPGKLHKVPFSVTLTGHLFDEARLIAIGATLEAALSSSGDWTPGARPPGPAA